MIIRNPLLTNGKGSMANMTFVGIQDGAVIAKGKIVNMTNPNTPDQQSTRSVFTLLVAQFKAMKALLNVINIPSTARRSPFNQYMANNISALKEQLGEADDSERNQMVLQLKEQLGDVNTATNSVVTTEVTTQPTFTSGVASIDLEWINDTDNPNSNAGDKLFIVQYNSGGQYYNIINPGVTRADETATISVERPAKGANIYYYYWKDAVLPLYSESFGVLAVPVTGNVEFIQTAVIS